MGLFQSLPMQPQPQSQPKIILNYPKVELSTELKLQKTKREQLERDDKLKHSEIIFDSKKIKHHIEEQLR
jgi:hypothetical protein